MLGYQRMQRQPRHRMHQHGLAEGRAACAPCPRRYIGASMWTKGSGTNSVKPPVRLQVAQRAADAAPSDCGPLDMAVHDGRRRAQADACAARCTSSHCAVLSLSGQITARTSSSRISAAVPGRVPRPASLQLAQELGDRRPSVSAPCAISSGEKAWMCMSGHAALTARQMRDRCRRYSRDGCRPACRLRSRRDPRPRRRGADFLDAPDHRACRADASCVLPLEKAQKLQLIVADVGVVDVAVDDVASRCRR